MFVLSVFFGCLQVIIHELGHYFAYLAYGYSPVLHYESVSCSQPIESWSAGIVISVAGFGLTVAISLVCLTLAYLTKNLVFGSLGIVMALRNVVALPFWPTYGADENNVSVALGIPYFTLFIVVLLINLLTIGLIMNAFEKGRLGILTTTVSGGTIGMFLWILWLGPKMLP